MTIHKGLKYTITKVTGTDGVMAEKSDGKSTRTMKYYPERDAGALAGCADEPTIWRLIADMAEALPSDTPLSPEHVLIDNEGFVLSPWSESIDKRFTAPEGYSAVWALGATAFYVFMGCHVFQGLGGKGQKASTPIPVMRKECPELSKLVARCLAYYPAERPDIDAIKDEAKEALERIDSKPKQQLPLKNERKNISDDAIDSLWPEKME